jgi:hypothetical protein
VKGFGCRPVVTYMRALRAGVQLCASVQQLVMVRVVRFIQVNKQHPFV